MRRASLTVSFICAVSYCMAQSVEDVVLQTEQNSTVLSAWQEQSKADKIGNSVGILPENPEVEFHY
ncbi:MAG: TolC family protein, partial [Dysgonamonadaceae bacterium]|nr:TolC family protein [Dysgonamonadaceae bacterium]